jgi:uncharacterized membrane protein
MKRLNWTQFFVIAVLAVSLVANFFLMGVIAKSMRDGPTPAAAGQVLTGALLRTLETYPPEVRVQFRALLRENRATTQSLRREARDARQALLAATQAQPFNEPAARAAAERARIATGALQAHLQDLFIDALSSQQKAASEKIGVQKEGAQK